MNIRSRLMILTLLAILILLVFIPVSPRFQKIPERDSGVFLYFGQQILNGKVPYRDLWDQKPPAIFYINALALGLSQGSRWGVWAFELLSMAVAVGVGYALLAGSFSRTAAVLGMVFLLRGVYVGLDGGNLPEEFVIPLQLAAVFIFWLWMRQPRLTKVLCLGIIFAAAALFKPNTAILPAIAIGYILIFGIIKRNGLRQFCLNAGAFLLGAGIIGIPFFLYLFQQKALADFWSQVGVYNLLYAQAGIKARLETIFWGIASLDPLSTLSMICWVAGAGSIVFYKGWKKLESYHLIIICLIDFPLEVILSSLSGRQYPHYLLAWLAPASILLALLAELFPEKILEIRKNLSLNASSLWLSAAILVVWFPVVWNTALYLNVRKSTTSSGTQVVTSLANQTSAQEYVLIWGADAGYNFLADRQSPTRYVYQYPLYQAGYRQDWMAAELLNDITQKKPVIIDTSYTNTLIPPLDPAARQAWASANDPETVAFLAPIFAYIDQHYKQTGTVGPSHWVIYRSTDK